MELAGRTVEGDISDQISDFRRRLGERLEVVALRTR